jgi:hypothetical protein
MIRSMGSVTGAQLLERTGEMAVLARAVRSARDGIGGVVLIEGAAGIGKSSLLQEGAREAERCGLRVLRGRGDELVVESSFAAVRELFWERVREIGVDALWRYQCSPPSPVLAAIGIALPPYCTGFTGSPQTSLTTVRSCWLSMMCSGSTPPQPGSSII